MLFRNTLVLFLMFLSLPVYAQDDLYLQQLIQQSREMHLGEHIEWLNLLHYKPYPYWPGARSLADGQTFFNAIDGKTNAASELEATLRAFFSTIKETDKQQNPQCRFVARYHWLDQQLKFDPMRLQPQECKRLNSWIKTLNPYEITLVFPSSYINSPASMYGHTLLRIDAKDQDERTRLLAYTVGYTAVSDETNGLLFAIQGLIGGGPGMFLTAPYYRKVSEYSDMENRDIWEYRLKLTPEEINRMMMHIWELGPTNFDYYFIDENCAYNLLSLLDVARPGLQMTDDFRWWAIPTDTVRAVTENTNLLKEVIYRPSNATVIMQRLRSMQPPLRQLSKALSDGIMHSGNDKVRQLPPEQQAQVLELSYDYVTYLRANKGDWPEASAISKELLLARSELSVPAATPEVEIPKTRPDQGHKSLKMGLGIGNRDGVSYEELTIRPAYHDQNDPGAGYIQGAQIQFFNLALRHYGDGVGSRVEELMPIDVFSLSPRNDFFQSLSWKVNFGWSRKRMADGSEPLLARFNSGVGLAWDASSSEQRTFLTYVFMDATLENSGHYSRDYAFGIGPDAGVITDVNTNWRVSAYARIQRFGLGEPHTAADFTLLQRYSVGPQTALRLELSRKMEFDIVWSDVKFSVQQYF